MIMEGARIFVLLLGIGLCFGTEDQQAPRSARTIARFFGLASNPQPQQQPQQVLQQQPQVTPQVRKPVPLIYSVKYYDRTGEGEKVDVVPDHAVVQDRVQGVPTRVFLNLYTGQQTPVYYDNKGQLLVPCPVYDHLYVAGMDPSLVRKPAPSKVVQTPVVPPQLPVPQVQVPVPVPEIVYYAAPSFLGHNPVQKSNGGVGLTVVGVPYDFPYYPGIYPYGNGAYNPYGNGGYNPYVYIKPSPTGHQHGHPQSAVGQTHQQPVAQVVEKKEVEKTD